MTSDTRPSTLPLDVGITLNEFLDEEAAGGPWRPEPPPEDMPWESLPSFWLTNDAGDSLLLDALIVSALLNAALETRYSRLLEERVAPESESELRFAAGDR